MKKRYLVLGIITALVLFCWANNTSLFSDKNGRYRLLAHRGVAQTFDVSQVEWDTNTAAVIYPPEHDYLENTLPSMQAAFDCGADTVELDIKRTQDDKLAVFHDFDLSMRTNATGEPLDYTMAQLKQLDVGYGYTADSGKTYPFRGKGIGLMPELGEVLATFPDKQLLIHCKDSDPVTAQLLWDTLATLTPERLAQIAVYGDDESMAYLQKQCPTLRVMSKATLKTALLEYELLGWTGYIPKLMRGAQLHIPAKFAPFLWGWPNKFMERMDSVGTNVVLVEGDGKWSEGFDTVDALAKIPNGFTGYVWTNRVDVVGDVA